MLKYLMPIIIGLLVITGMYCISIYNFLLFHGLLELFSIIIGFGIFMIVCIAYKFMQNAFVMTLGTAYLFIGILDIFHLFAFEGMGIFSDYGANLPTQLWIQARLLESLSICLGLYILKEKSWLNFKIISGAYTIIFCLLILMTFSGFFPDCYIEGSGLTSFKKLCEYLISMILLIAVLMLQKRQHMFEAAVIKLLYASIFTKIGSELALTVHISVYELSNFTGLFLKGLSSYLIYRAIIKTGIETPYLLLRQTGQAMRQYAAIIKSSREGIISINTEGTIITWNPGAEHIFGYRADEITGQSILKLVPAESMDQGASFIQRVKQGETVKAEEVLRVTKYGIKIYVSMSLAPILDNNGNIVSITGIISDITEKKDAENALENAYNDLERRVKERTAELLHAKEAAESANRAKTLFLANMNHELRTPLNSILGFAQIIHNDPAIPVNHRKNTLLMLKSGEHLLNLINNILEMAKIESGRITLNKTSFNLAELLDTVKEMILHRIKDKDIQLNIKLGPNLPDTIKTDEGKLRQILINLLGNSAKFTEKGNINLRINHTGKNQDYEVSKNIMLDFEIEDTGSGILPKDIEFIFEPFNQSRDKNYKPEGTGLGLTITRQFIRLMGGNISVSSKLGAGSTFKFNISVLPAVEYNISAEKKNPSFKLLPGQALQRILVVEDNILNSLILKEMLEFAGFAVNQAVNGQEAIKKYKKYAHDLILMDLMLPEIDGFEVTKIIRKIEAADNNKADSHKTKNRVPIIAISAASFDSMKEASLAAGCDDFMPKPFLNYDLFMMIKKYLGIKYISDKPNNLQDRHMAHETFLSNIACLPVELLDQIGKNLIEGNHKQVLFHIDEVRSFNLPLADNLARMVQKFEYKKLLSLISETGNNKKYE